MRVLRGMGLAASGAGLSLLLAGCGGSSSQAPATNYRLSVLDEYDNPIAGAEVSVYRADQSYDIMTDAGDPKTLVPKASPDAVTQGDGTAMLALEDGVSYAVVVKAPGCVTARLAGIDASKPGQEVCCYPGNDMSTYFFGHTEGSYGVGEPIQCLTKGVNASNSYDMQALLKVYKVLPGPDLLVWPGNQSDPNDTITAEGAGPNKEPYENNPWAMDSVLFSNYGPGTYKRVACWMEGGEKRQDLGTFEIHP